MLLWVWATLTGLQRKVENTEFLSLDNILLWPAAEARPWVFDTIPSGMGKLLRNYRLLIVNKRSRQEKTRHFCQGNITRWWVLAGNRGAWTWSARILLTSTFRSTASQLHGCLVSLAGSRFCLFTQWHKNKVCVGTEPVVAGTAERVGLGVGKSREGGGGGVFFRVFF